LTSLNFIPAPDQGDAQVVVLGAELHPAAVAIVLVTTIFEELVAEGIFGPKNPKLKVEDDVGTEYRRSPGLSVSRIGSEGGWSVVPRRPPHGPRVPTTRPAERLLPADHAR
jgi:hypothetical protein